MNLSNEELQKPLRAAEQQIKASEQRAEALKQQTKASEQRTEALKQQIKASEQQIKASEQRTEALKQQIKASKQRTEALEHQIKASKQRTEALEQQTRKTTLNEYMNLCHQLVFNNFTIETDPKLQSKGSITSPQNKWCPTSLREWPGFLQRQREVFGLLYDNLPAREKRTFKNRHVLETLGQRASRLRIADERGLEMFLRDAVEGPVWDVVDYLVSETEVAKAFDLGRGIVFEDYPHALSELDEEVMDRQALSTPAKMRGQRENLKKFQADQIFIYRSDDARTSRTRPFMFEYKAPHQLTVPHLRLGLRAMNIHEDVVNRKTIPTSSDPEALFAYHADKLTASAVTQIYNYMVEDGLEYSLLTTGEAFVFLRIDWDEPETLYYHLAEPGPEVKAQIEAQTPNAHLCTAVGQYLAFILMAVQGISNRQNTQDERDEAMRNLKTWAVDFESTYRSIPEADRSIQTISAIPVKRKRDDGSGSSDEQPGSRRSQCLALRRRGDNIKGDRQRQQKQHQQQQFCTQKCLLGLVRGHALDKSCPNAKLHLQGDQQQSSKKSSPPQQHYHLITATQWLDLLREQLQKSLDIGISPLGCGGSRGVLFKVTLLAYGYTFVSKGTIKAYIPDLEHEARIYRHLERIQGVYVPVFLGAIDLRPLGRTYYFDHRVYIVHMTFLAWGGQSIRTVLKEGHHQKEKADVLRPHVIRVLQAIHEQGIIHQDVRPDNVLVCNNANAAEARVMMIDFERSKILTAPNRRTSTEGILQKCRKKNVSGEFAQEIDEVNTLFE